MCPHTQLSLMATPKYEKGGRACTYTRTHFTATWEGSETISAKVNNMLLSSPDGRGAALTLTWLQAENVTSVFPGFDFLLCACYSPSSLHVLIQTRLAAPLN